MSTNHAHKQVFVGISGGVDSSVAAALLKEQGYSVTGVFIKIWHKELSQCDWRQEMQDAMRVCATLDIPFQMIDLSDVYMERVITYMITSYEQGITPNPDVMCNNSVKFGAFFDWAMEQGADYVATGHYAQVQSGGTLHVAIDTAKDQSYFLWNVPKERFTKVLLPIGEYQKKDVRHLAQRFRLLTATKPDSQGLCFIGDVDIKAFLQRELETKHGDVLDIHGTVIGTHKGAELYTHGERHGFLITTRDTQTLPHYIIAKDIEKNTITVSTDPQKDTAYRTVHLKQVNWLSDTIPQTASVSFRYHGTLHNVICEPSTEGTCVLHLAHPTADISEGQSAVLYQGTQCLGGGVISYAV